MPSFDIRPIEARDDEATAAVIRKVLGEYGLNREGFAFVDSELAALSEHYCLPRAAYFVAELDGVIVGGAGFAPLLGGDPLTAELKKMYLLRHARGLGFGGKLMRAIMPLAKAGGYSRIYLETVPEMTDAIRLYEKYGFEAIGTAMGNTGHFGCQAYFVKNLL